MVELGVFHFLAFLITVCSIFVIATRHPVKSAVFLVVDLFLMAAVFALLEAHFVAAIQVLVYAGAITVLFVFVIMLLNLKEEESSFSMSVLDVAGLLFMLVGFAVAMVKIYFGGSHGSAGSVVTPQVMDGAGGNTKVVALQLLGKYIWPFEIASILILLAIVASIVIAKKDKPETKEVSRGAG